MSKLKKYLKGRFHLLRQKFKVVKKSLKKAKWLLVYGDFILGLTNGIVPSKAIGLPIFPITPPIMRSIHSYTPKKVVIASVIDNSPDKIVFSEKQMKKLYEIALKYKDNSISTEEVILELRGGDIQDWAAALGIVITIITVLNNVSGFQLPPGAIIPPHLQWLYKNNQPLNHFGDGKKAIQNAASQKKEPSSGSYNYIDVMKELKKQSHQKTLDIQVGNQSYIIKNPYRLYAEDLQFVLAEKVYDSIRKSDTDIRDIASNLGFKADNIKNVKDHIFYNEHDLDSYAAEEIEHKRFDATLPQALAWKRLEAGTHNQDDVTWIKHECAERHYELKHNSGYSKAHERAESHYKGYPWEDE
jgi:hypothetical protein